MEIMEIDTYFWKNRRVLVTGHTGFKGSWLCLALRKYQAIIYGYSLNEEANNLLQGSNSCASKCYIEDMRDTINNGDALKSALLRWRPEVIFHLAAQAIVSESYTDAVGTWEVNTIGTLRLLGICREIKLNAAIVVVTSDKVYKQTSTKVVYTEDACLGGKDPYGASKAACEIASEAFCGIMMLDSDYNIRVATARSGNVIGGGDMSKHRLIPDMERALNGDSDMVVRFSDAVRPWQHVLEPVYGYLLLAEELSKGSKGFNGAYNFGPDRKDNELRVIDVVNYYGQLNGNRLRTRVVANPVTRQMETSYLMIDSKKAKEHLGWRPVWTARQAIEATARCYQDLGGGEEWDQRCLLDLQEFERAMYEGRS